MASRQPMRQPLPHCFWNPQRIRLAAATQAKPAPKDTNEGQPTIASKKLYNKNAGR